MFWTVVQLLVFTIFILSFRYEFFEMAPEPGDIKGVQEDLGRAAWQAWQGKAWHGRANLGQ